VFKNKDSGRMSTIMEGTEMKRFIQITEHIMTDQKYNDLVKNGFEPTEFITSVTADHARDRGLETRTRCMETDYDILDDVCKSIDTIATDKAFDEIEEVMLNNSLCVSGNCGE
jgi:hypothetical protein